MNGKADKHSRVVKEIKSKFDAETLQRVLAAGVKVEYEHTDSDVEATEIVWDHLVEWYMEHGNLEYYPHLKKMEQRGMCKSEFSFDYFFKALPGSHHKPYTRRSKSGKLSVIGPLGVAKMATKNPFMGKKFTAEDLPKDTKLKDFLTSMGVELNGYGIPSDVPRDKINIDLTGDLDSHAVIVYTTYPKNKRTEKVSDVLDTRRVYTTHHKASSDAKKWERVKELDPIFDAKLPKFKKLMLDKTKSVREREAAAMLFIIGKTGLRHGSKEQYEKSRSRGISTLGPGSVKIEGSVVSIAFTGKSQGANSAKIDDPDLAKFLAWRKEEGLIASGGTRPTYLWKYPATSYIERVKEAEGLGGYHVHDFRYLVASRLAALEMAKHRPKFKRGDTKAMIKAFKAYVKIIATVVGNKICNGPEMAIKSYISPALWIAWFEQNGGDYSEIATVRNAIEALDKSMSSGEVMLRFKDLWRRAKAITLEGYDQDIGDDLDSEEDEDHPFVWGRKSDTMNTTMSKAEIEILEKANKPYGHTGYTRTNKKTGKISRVAARGVKPQKPAKGGSTTATAAKLTARMRITRDNYDTKELYLSDAAEEASRMSRDQEYYTSSESTAVLREFKHASDAYANASHDAMINDFVCLGKIAMLGVNLGNNRATLNALGAAAKKAAMSEHKWLTAKTAAELAGYQGDMYDNRCYNPSITRAQKEKYKALAMRWWGRSENYYNKANSLELAHGEDYERAEELLRTVQDQKIGKSDLPDYWADPMYDGASTVEDLVKSDII